MHTVKPGFNDFGYSDNRFKAIRLNGIDYFLKQLTMFWLRTTIIFSILEIFGGDRYSQVIFSPIVCTQRFGLVIDILVYGVILS